MSAEPTNADDYWHVRSVPKEYLTAGMATILVFEDTAIGTFYHYCRIDEQGYVRVLREGGTLPYLKMGETRPVDAHPPVTNGEEGGGQ